MQKGKKYYFFYKDKFLNNITRIKQDKLLVINIYFEAENKVINEHRFNLYNFCETLATLMEKHV